MPNCFSLTRRSEPDKGPVNLIDLDKEMCEHFQAPCDGTHWHYGWYNYIGFLIAVGKDWQWLKDDIASEVAKNDDSKDYWLHLEEIRAWLEANFTYDAWAEIGRR